MANPYPRPIEQGTIVVTIALPMPWPFPHEIEISSCELEGREAVIRSDDIGRLHVLILDKNGNLLLENYSSVLEISEQTEMTVAMTWELPNILTIAVNGTIVGSLPSDSKIPKVFKIEKYNPSLRDHAKDNEKAVKTRRDTLAGWQDIPRRIPGSHENIQSALEDEIGQIADLLAHLDQGKFYHLKGLSSRLRMMISTGKPLPLLQQFAATKDLPLIVYTTSDTSMRTVSDGAFSIQVSIQPKPTKKAANPVDLDVWLDLPAGLVDNKIHTNRMMIKSFGDTIGSHYDKDELPIVNVLKSMKSGLSGKDANLIIVYLKEVAETVLELARSTIK